MTGTQEQSRGEGANIPTPPDIAAVTMLPPSDRVPHAPEVGMRGHQSDATGQPATMTFASESHEYIREYIRNADQKAIFYFSVCSALLAFEHTQNWSQRWTKLPSEWSALDLVTCAAMIGLALAAACFLYVVIPRLGGSPRGLIFFKSVAAYANAEEYVSDVVKRSEADLASEKLRHCHELAKVASSKYTALAAGLRVGGVAILCSLVLLVSVPPRNGNDPTKPPTTSAPSLK
ncbi:Pycsar system effector family protein [Dyella koreensis]|uniref:Pycsar effector protein domain-containing protein n=1 Tax=Dyella koreensis TaxID=311235 RepID=A0ABW8K8I5_9GAMM